jgi:hypothetical protein
MPPAPGNATSQYVRTESGNARRVVQSDEVVCEASGPGSTGFLQAPIGMPESQCTYSPCPGGMHADQVVVTASGAFHWSDGNIGGVGSDWAQTDTTLDCGQTYHISGWTVLPSSDTRFTNDGTGHGMSASIENVYSFLLQVMKFSRWEEVNRLKTIAALVAATPLARSYWALAPARLIATPTATTAATPAITASPTATEARGG